MYRFEHPYFLYVIPIVIGLAFLLFSIAHKQQRKAIADLGDDALIGSQLRGRIPHRGLVIFSLLAGTLLFLLLGAANLQRSGGKKSGEQRGVDVMIALDVSRSMLATDVQPNRLDRAKQLIQLTLDRFKGHRAGLILFAGRAYVQVPLTTDYAALRMMMQSAVPNLIPQQGTVLSDAINTADQSFSQLEKKHKLLVLITDGEDHDERADESAKKAVENGVKIVTVGIGSPEGTVLMDEVTGKPKLDEAGNKVITKLNETELKEIAGIGMGSYFHMRNTNSTAVAVADIANGMEGKSLGVSSFTDYDSYFQYFLLAALSLLLLTGLLPKATKHFKTQIV